MSACTSQYDYLADLPSMPALLMKALHQLNDVQDLTALADQISADPPMAIRILRIVNSPFYGMSREIGSLKEAIILLGLNRIRDMLISICFSKMLPVQHEDFNHNLFWHHSLAVAECARQLADCTGANPNLAFTAGLLHDIGNLVIVMFFPEKFRQLIEISVTFGIEIEQKLLGFDHAVIGGKAAQHWNLPVAIQEAIEQHETPPSSNTGKSLGVLIYTANLLIIKSEQFDESILKEPLAILNVSSDQAAHFTKCGQQFAEQILALS